MAGQRLFNHQGLLGGGADHHRQPVWFHLPPLLLARWLQEVSRQAGGKQHLTWHLAVGAACSLVGACQREKPGGGRDAAAPTWLMLASLNGYLV